MPDRGEVWLADLDPRHGTEPGKTRPVLVIQAQALQDCGHPSTIVIPLTSNMKRMPSPCACGFLLPGVCAAGRTFS